MKLGCLINLAVYAALVAGYYHWLSPTVESPAVWIVSCVSAFLSGCALGALYNAMLSMKDHRAVEAALAGLPPRHGHWTAVAGPMVALQSPVVSPFTETQCALCEYEIFRNIEVRTGGKNPRTDIQHKVDFSGIHMNACAVVAGNERVRIVGFPDMEVIEASYPSQHQHYQNALEHVRRTAWEDCSGMKVFLGAGGMWKVLTTAEEEYHHDWRSISPEDCPWLAGEPVPSTVQTSFDEEAFDDKEEEEDEFVTEGIHPSNAGYSPSLQEKRIDIGEEVVALGYYDAMRSALVTSAKKNGRMIRIYRDSLPKVAQKVGGSTKQLFAGGLIGLIAIQAAVYLGHKIYCSSDATQREWKEIARKAVREGDTSTVQQMLDRGIDVDSPNDDGETLLMLAEDPALIHYLLDNQANLNAQDKKGYTAVIHAVHYRRHEALKKLIAAGANLELKSTELGNTALMIAIDADRPEAAEILRAAGAKDDVVTAETGQPVLSADPPFVACQKYIQAIHARDEAQLRALSTASGQMSFEDANWDLWSNTRPLSPRMVEGFVRGEDATITISGKTAGDFQATWVMQLKLSGGEWKVRRQRWVNE